MQQGEHGRVAKREDLADDEVDEKPCDPGPIGVLCYQGAEYERKVQPREAGQLRGDHHGSQRGSRHQPEYRPPEPVHDVAGQPRRLRVNRTLRQSSVVRRPARREERHNGDRWYGPRTAPVSRTTAHLLAHSGPCGAIRAFLS